MIDAEGLGIHEAAIIIGISRLGDQTDRAAHRRRAKECALWTAQNLDALQVENARVE